MSKRMTVLQLEKTKRVIAALPKNDCQRSSSARDLVLKLYGALLL